MDGLATINPLLKPDESIQATPVGTLMCHNILSAGKDASIHELFGILVTRQPHRANEILHYVKKANELAKIAEENEQTEKSLRDQIEQTSKDDTLDVSDVAHERVRLRIGNREVRLDADRQGVRYFPSKKADGPELTYAALTHEGSESQRYCRKTHL